MTSLEGIRQDSWPKWLTRKAIVTTGTTIGAGLGACAAVWSAIYGTNLCKTTTIATVDFMLQGVSSRTASMVAVPLGLTATGINVFSYGAAGAVAGGIVGYVAADQVAKMVLG